MLEVRKASDLDKSAIKYMDHRIVLDLLNKINKEKILLHHQMKK
jgi:hypothetical protein